MSLFQLVTGLARRILVNDKSSKAASPQRQRPQSESATSSAPSPSTPSASPQAATPPAEPLQPADEATIRHRAEAELGGMSSEESRRAWERGENPGGLHHKGHGPTAPQRGTHDPAPVLDPPERGESN